jgi:23S rRNA (cytosine1962-C5)-methyltransferase
MFAPDQYALLDFGEGRKLERFGPYVLDRPCPEASGERRADPDSWSRAVGYFEKRGRGRGGRWRIQPELPASWSIQHDCVQFEIRPTEWGQLGLFAEQAANWDWMSERVARRTSCRLLNLFAHTGGGTLAAAAKGARVVHVDAARNAVAWARRNAVRSRLDQAPVRWIVEDAIRFVHREMRRGQRYDAIVLDPPSYGHGPRGESWKLARDLPPLLQACAQLLAPQPGFLLLTAHTPGYGPAELAPLLAQCIRGLPPADVQSTRLSLTSTDGRRLSSGVVALADFESR